MKTPLEVACAERRRAKYRDGTLSKHHDDAKRFKAEYIAQAVKPYDVSVHPYRWYIQFLVAARVDDATPSGTRWMQYQPGDLLRHYYFKRMGYYSYSYSRHAMAVKRITVHLEPLVRDKDVRVIQGRFITNPTTGVECIYPSNTRKPERL